MNHVPQISIVVHGRWHAFELARELHQLGALHRIVTSYPRSRTRLWSIPDDKVVSLPLQLVLTKLAWKFGGNHLAMQQQFRINDLFARHAARHLGNPDLVHAWSGAAEPSLLAARKRGIPTVLERSSSHMAVQCRLLRAEYAALGLTWEETPSAGVARELREYELADCLFVPSQFVWRSFLEEGFSPDRLRLNGFGADCRAFSAGSGPTDGIFRVVYAGSLSVRKGLHHLVEGFRRANLPHSELVLVGGALPETQRLLGPSDGRIIRTGHLPQSELVQHYRRSSVFVMASIEEGQAVVQAQALACGLPLICSANTGGEDFLARRGGAEARSAQGIQEFPAGYVVPARSPDAIAECLGKLHASPALLAAKRAAAMELGPAGLGWSDYGRRALAHYVGLLSQRGARPGPVRAAAEVLT